MVVRLGILEDISGGEDRILCFLHFMYPRSSQIYFRAVDLQEAARIKYSRAAVAALDELVAKGHVAVNKSIVFDDDPEPGYEITVAGIARAEALDVEIYSRLIDGCEVFGSDLVVNGEIPASDRVVTLNHNQPDYQQAVEALDKVLEEFRNDHRLDNELGPQKEAHLKVLEAGRKALEDKEISLENGQDWIVKPLKWIVEKFADGAVKVLALKAMEAIAKLF